jgi:hypothetical protein
LRREGERNRLACQDMSHIKGCSRKRRGREREGRGKGEEREECIVRKEKCAAY